MYCTYLVAGKHDRGILACRLSWKVKPRLTTTCLPRHEPDVQILAMATVQYRIITTQEWRSNRQHGKTPAPMYQPFDRNAQKQNTTSCLRERVTRSSLLELLFGKVLGCVRSFVIDVNVTSFNIGQALELDLQGFRNVVRLLEGLMLVHYNVYLDDDAWA